MEADIADCLPLRIDEIGEIISRPNVAILAEGTACKWRPPLFVADLSGRAINHHLHRHRIRATRSTYVGRYADQHLFGFHHFHGMIGPSGEFNCQELGKYRARLEWLIRNQPPPEFAIPRVAKDDAGFVASMGEALARRSRPIEDQVFFGSPIEPANWGLWLLYGLESAWSFVASGQRGKYLCAASRDWQRKLLQFMGVSADRLIPQEGWVTYRCRDVALHQHTGINLVPTLATQLICETIRARCRASVDAPSVEKIFVSRRSMTKRLGIRYRGLTNEDELCEALAEKGFAIVEPEQLSFQDQVRLFESAKIVVGLGGAGMFNVLFSRPGTKVITIESNAAFVHDHAALFASLALDYGVIFGLQDESCNRYPHNPWSLDVPAAVRHILAAL